MKLKKGSVFQTKKLRWKSVIVQSTTCGSLQSRRAAIEMGESTFELASVDSNAGKDSGFVNVGLITLGNLSPDPHCTSLPVLESVCLVEQQDPQRLWEATLH